MAASKPGDFSQFIFKDADEEYFSNQLLITMHDTAYKAVSYVDGGWEFMRSYIPGEDGFLFSKPPPILKAINDKLESLYDGHSGASYAAIMRRMENIAKNGWPAFVRMMHATDKN